MWLGNSYLILLMTILVSNCRGQLPGAPPVTTQPSNANAAAAAAAASAAAAAASANSAAAAANAANAFIPYNVNVQYPIQFPLTVEILPSVAGSIEIINPYVYTYGYGYSPGSYQSSVPVGVPAYG